MDWCHPCDVDNLICCSRMENEGGMSHANCLWNVEEYQLLTTHPRSHPSNI